MTEEEIKVILKKMIDSCDVLLVGVNSNYSVVEGCEELLNDVLGNTKGVNPPKAFTLHLKLGRV